MTKLTTGLFLCALLAAGPAWAVPTIPAPQPIAPAVLPDVQDLDLVEVPATAPAPGRDHDTMAIVLSGDGGWAFLDSGVARQMAAEGIPVVGWSSLHYYWTPRTPEGAAADLGRIIEHYTTAWHKSRVLVVGYSFGADVAPFLVNRLTPEAASHVGGVALLGLSPSATFEFHVANWLGASKGSEYPTAPEVERLRVPVDCIYGADDEMQCATVHGPHIVSTEIGRGHHFSGRYTKLVNVILDDRPSLVTDRRLTR